jgi:DNA-binding NarL/FixJ family response regulator
MDFCPSAVVVRIGQRHTGVMESEVTPRTITVLLVDDEASVRRGLRMRLSREPDLVVIGEACDEEHALSLAETLRPDIVLLDVALPGQDGIGTAKILQTVVPGSAVVMLTLHDDTVTRARATAAGARTLIGKHEPIPKLLEAIRAAAT